MVFFFAAGNKDSDQTAHMHKLICLSWAHMSEGTVFTYVFGQTGLSKQCRPDETPHIQQFSTQHQVVNCTCSNFRTNMVRSLGVPILRVNTVRFFTLHLICLCLLCQGDWIHLDDSLGRFSGHFL